jgi:single-stranded DNA-binding protein
MDASQEMEVVNGDANEFVIFGEVVGDTRVVDTKNRVPLCMFKIRNVRAYVNRQEVSEFDVEAWGGLGGWCGHTLQDRDKVKIRGRIKQDKWTDRFGKYTSKIKLVADNVEVTDKYHSL